MAWLGFTVRVRVRDRGIGVRSSGRVRARVCVTRDSAAEEERSP